MAVFQQNFFLQILKFEFHTTFMGQEVFFNFFPSHLKCKNYR